MFTFIIKVYHSQTCNWHLHIMHMIPPWYFLLHSLELHLHEFKSHVRMFFQPCHKGGLILRDSSFTFFVSKKCPCVLICNISNRTKDTSNPNLWVYYSGKHNLTNKTTVLLNFTKHPKYNTFTSTIFEVIDNILQKYPNYNHIYT